MSPTFFLLWKCSLQMTCSDANDTIVLWFFVNFLKELLKFSFLEQNQNSSVFWIQALHNLAPPVSHTSPKWSPPHSMKNICIISLSQALYPVPSMWNAHYYPNLTSSPSKRLLSVVRQEGFLSHWIMVFKSLKSTQSHTENFKLLTVTLC